VNKKDVGSTVEHKAIDSFVIDCKGNKVLLEPREFYYSVLKKSFNGSYENNQEFKDAFSNEKNIVDTVIKTEEIGISRMHCSKLFILLQCVEGDERRYFLGIERKKPVTLNEAIEDFTSDENGCSKAYRKQFEYKPVDCIVFHCLWQMRHDIVTSWQHNKYKDISFEECSKRFAYDRASNFYNHFQKNAVELIEKIYLPKRLKMIQKEDEQKPIDDELKQIESVLVS
jgi:hypothetical protein